MTQLDGVERRTIEASRQRRLKLADDATARQRLHGFDILADQVARNRTSTVTVRTVNQSGVTVGGTRARARGGPVWPNEPFLVGEEGPELVEFDGHATVRDAATTRSRLASTRTGGGRSVMPAASPQTVMHNTITVQAHDVDEAARKLSERLGWEALKAGGWN